MTASLLSRGEGESYEIQTQLTTITRKSLNLWGTAVDVWSSMTGTSSATSVFIGVISLLTTS